MAHALANGETVTDFESEGAAASEVAALWRDIRKAALTVRAAAALTGREWQRDQH
jgi:hypothetical protein